MRLSSLLEQIAEVLKVIQQRIVEPIVDGPVPLAEFVGVWASLCLGPCMEDDAGAVRFTPQERVQNRMLEQTMDSPVPQIMEDSLPVVPHERVQNRTQEQIVGVPVPQIMEAPVDVVVTTPQERVQNRTLEQIVDFLVPQNMGDYAGVVRATPRELVQNCSFVRQITEEIGDGVQQVAFEAHARTSWRLQHQGFGQVQHAWCRCCPGHCPRQAS